MNFYYFCKLIFKVHERGFKFHHIGFRRRHQPHGQGHSRGAFGMEFDRACSRLVAGCHQQAIVPPTIPAAAFGSWRCRPHQPAASRMDTHPELHWILLPDLVYIGDFTFRPEDLRDFLS